MPPANARSYRFFVFFGIDFQQLTAKRLIRFVYQMSQIIKRYFPTAMCIYNVWRTPLCKYNVSGNVEGGQQESIHADSKYIKNLYNPTAETKKDSDLFKETYFQPFRRFLCFIAPDLKMEIMNELAKTMPNFDSHIRNVIMMTQESAVKLIGFSPRMRTRVIPQNTLLKRTFQTFEINGDTFAECPDLKFGCKMIFDRDVNYMSALVPAIPAD